MALLPVPGGNSKIPGDRAYAVAAACVCDMNQIMRFFESRLFWPKYRELLNSTGRLCIRRGIRPSRRGIGELPAPDQRLLLSVLDLDPDIHDLLTISLNRLKRH